MKHSLYYQNDKIILRPLEAQDAEPLRILRNRPENRIWFYYSNVISAEAQKKWYESYLTTELDYTFAILLPEKQTFCGAAAIYGYRSEDASFELGRLLLNSQNPDCKGLGKEIVRCLCALCASEDFRSHTGTYPKKLRAEILAKNTRSLNCFLINGFEQTGEAIRDGKTVALVSRDI